MHAIFLGNHAIFYCTDLPLTRPGVANKDYIIHGDCALPKHSTQGPDVITPFSNATRSPHANILSPIAQPGWCAANKEYGIDGDCTVPKHRTFLNATYFRVNPALFPNI